MVRVRARVRVRVRVRLRLRLRLRVIEADVGRLLVEALRVVVCLAPALEEQRTRGGNSGLRTRALLPVCNRGLARGGNSGLAPRSARRLGKSGVEAIDTRAEHGEGPRAQARHLTRGEINGDAGRYGEMYGR